MSASIKIGAHELIARQTVDGHMAITLVNGRAELYGFSFHKNKHG